MDMKTLYTKEFREEGVKLVTEGGLSVPVVAALRYLKEAAHQGNGIHESHLPFDRVRRCDSFAALFQK